MLLSVPAVSVMVIMFVILTLADKIGAYFNPQPVQHHTEHARINRIELCLYTLEYPPADLADLVDKEDSIHFCADDGGIGS